MHGETLMWIFQSVFFPVLLALLIILFLYGIVNYFVLGPNDMSREELGRNQLLMADAGFISIIIVVILFDSTLLAGLQNPFENLTSPATSTAPVPNPPGLR